MFNNPAQDANNRQAQRANRNASSFNIISFDPANSNQANADRQLKKDKQNAYRDQLDQMKTIKQDSRAHERLPSDNYNPASAALGDPTRERKAWGGDSDVYQAPQYEQRAPNREYEGYPSEQQYDDYGLDQRASGIQKNYNLVGSQGGSYGGEYQQQQQQRSRPITDSSGASTFEQQDALRGQLLDRIKGGYNNQNTNVYNAYQRAHEEREQSRQNFEHNVIERAAKEKSQREQEAAMKDWDKKKRLQMEMSEANKRAIDAKSSQKRREKEKDDILDHQRVQDSLAQHERSEYMQREKMRRMQEETNHSLQHQISQQATHKQQHGKEISPSKYKVGWDSIDSLTNSRVRDQPLKNSSQLMNQDPYGNRQPQYEDLSRGMGGLDIGGGLQKGHHEDPYADMYGARGYEQPSSNRVVDQGPQGGRSDYTKIKDKNRHGSGFNIITNEYR